MPPLSNLPYFLSFPFLGGPQLLTNVERKVLIGRSRALSNREMTAQFSALGSC